MKSTKILFPIWMKIYAFFFFFFAVKEMEF